jgi:hypothetical protein
MIEIRNSIVLATAAALACASSLGAATSAEDLTDDVIAIGPLASVSASGREVTVLGRTFHTRDSVAIATGEYVAVHADLKRDGTLSDAWIEVLGAYVPGSDLVYEKGIVSDVRPFLGQMSIGTSRIDYTPSMYGAAGVSPAVGEIVAVSGVQPQGGSSVLVDSLSAAADLAKNAVLRSGVYGAASIQGSGVNSASIQGSGFRSASIQGSGVNSASIQGSGFRSASIQGSGVNSASIQGSGFRSASIQGSGVNSASIQGSGFRSASIQGSGVNSASIQGSGFRSASIQGSGVNSASIQGSGVVSR